MKGLKWGLAFLALLISASLLPAAIGLWIRYEVQRRLDMSIQGTFIPVPFLPLFHLKGARLLWKDKIQVHSGDLKVGYRPLPALLKGDLALQVSGKDIPIRLLEGWAKIQGVRETTLQTLEADIVLGKRGIEEIRLLEARSPEFQFQLKPSENNKAQPIFPAKPT